MSGRKRWSVHKSALARLHRPSDHQRLWPEQTTYMEMKHCSRDSFYWVVVSLFYNTAVDLSKMRW